MLRLRRPLLALITLTVLLGGGYAASALRQPAAKTTRPVATATPRPGMTGTARPPATTGGSRSPVDVVPASSLPAEVGRTIALVRAGGPFPYSRDGVVFANREHRLPERPGGYYHEYTVPTPGESDRGARRLVTGTAEEFYYTQDHYVSFVGVDPDR